jgi:hypothetical protein
MKQCERCKKRGKTWKGSDPECGFKSGVFSPENWNCATANALRELVKDSVHWSEDQSLGVKSIDGTFMVVSWYKRGGRVEGIWIVDGQDKREITLAEAEEILTT